jgi:LacI family transcriptional regulator
MSRKYTISDIAKLVGVSKGTVDRVLHKRGKVSKTAYEKVTKILAEIDYQPNLMARNLKKNKIYRIALVFPNPEIDGYWSSCMDAIQSIKSEFQAFGIAIETYFFDPKSAVSFSEAQTTVLKSLPDALLLAPIFQKEALLAIENYSLSGILVATFNNRVHTQKNRSFIGQNLHQSGRVAAKLLANSVCNTGKLAIVHIDEKYKQALYIQEKEKGFRAYFEGVLDQKNKIITFKLKRANFEQQISEFLKTNTNLIGIFVTTSKAYEIIPFVKKYTTNKIAIVGYDLLPENVAFLKENSIDFLIHQNPKQQVYLGLKSLAEHLLFDKEINEQILLPIDIINAENVDLFVG